MGRRVGEEEQVVGRVAVVGGDEERPDAAEDGLGGGVAVEERVALDAEEVALGRVREAGCGCGVWGAGGGWLGSGGSRR